MVQNYLNKISGPLMDRIDLHIEVQPVRYDDLSDNTHQESSKEILEKVLKARRIQEKRFEDNDAIHCNAQMEASQLKKYCKLEQEARKLLKNAMDHYQLSARSYDRILKVSRSIADLEQNEHIQSHHIAEAIQYRSLDKEKWLK